MAGFLKAKDLNLKELGDLLGGLPEEMWMVVETPEALLFSHFSLGSILPEQAYRGRVFSPFGEVKWRKIGDQYRTVFLGKMDLTKDFLEDHSSKLEGLTYSYHKYILWGERKEGDSFWIEQIVPHRFDYPFKGLRKPQRLSIKAEEWADSLSGQILFSRFVSLEEAGGDENAAG